MKQTLEIIGFLCFAGIIIFSILSVASLVPMPIDEIPRWKFVLYSLGCAVILGIIAALHDQRQKEK